MIHSFVQQMRHCTGSRTKTELFLKMSGSIFAIMLLLLICFLWTMGKFLQRKSKKGILYFIGFVNMIQMERPSLTELVNSIETAKIKVAGAFIKWSDVFYSGWNSPEWSSCTYFKQVYVWQLAINLSNLHNKLKCRLDHFLKSTFTEDMDHKHIDKIIIRWKHLISWFVNTKSIMKMWIFLPALSLSIWTVTILIP